MIVSDTATMQLGRLLHIAGLLREDYIDYNMHVLWTMSISN